MGSCDLPRDMKPEAAAGNAAYAGTPVELIEDLLPLIFRNSRTAIEDFSYDPFRFRLGQKLNRGGGH